MTRLIKFPFEWVVDHLCRTYSFLKHFHTNFIYLYLYVYLLWICLNFCSEKRKFEGVLSQLVIMLFTWNFEGGLIEHQPCFIQNFKFLAVQEPAFQKSKFGRNRLLTVFLNVYRPGKCFFLYLDLSLGLCRAVFPVSLVSPIGLPAY